MKYSIVVPLKDEQDNVSKLDSEIRNVMKNLIGDYEVIYINDGSIDNTLHELKKLNNVKIVDLNKNYGQAVALDAGFKQAAGEIVISLDGDLQNDPADIPAMIEMLKKEKLDVVCGWRKNRKDKGGIKILTRIGRFIRGILIKDHVHDTGCTLRVYTREAVKSLDLWGEMHRYILALLRWKGFKIGEMVVNHRARIHGKTKYGYDKALKGFLDLIYIWFISKFSSRPLHLFGTAGLISFFVGILIEIWMAIGKVFYQYDLSNTGWFLLGFFLIITGVILFTFGIMIDLLIRIHLTNSPEERRYYIRKVIHL